MATTTVYVYNHKYFVDCGMNDTLKVFATRNKADEFMRNELNAYIFGQDKDAWTDGDGNGIEACITKGYAYIPDSSELIIFPAELMQ